MAKKPTPEPSRAVLNAQDIKRGISRLEKVRTDLENFEYAQITQRRDPSVSGMKSRIGEAVEKTFPRGSTQYIRFRRAEDISPSVVLSQRTPPLSEYVREVREAFSRSISLLEEAIRSLNDDLSELQDEDVYDEADASFPPTLSTDIFIVHGHDDAAKQEVARVIEKLGLKPIILHEQPAKGRTIIEKFEGSSEVGFAIVLLTPDDVGGKNRESLTERARQNVIAELGYFVGKLSRQRVCALRKGNTEVPSDFAGVEYVDFEPAGAWKFILGRELQAAGYFVDLNKLI